MKLTTEASKKSARSWSNLRSNKNILSFFLCETSVFSAPLW